MKRNLCGMLAALAVVVLPGAFASAQEITYASHAEIMSVLERQNQRIAELEANGNAGVGGGGGSCCGNGCTSCGGGCGSCCESSCCDPCVRSCGVVGGAEVSFLKFHSTAGANGPVVNSELPFGYDLTPRLWAGVQGSDGLGVRARYWEFDHAETNDIETIDVDTYVFDVEAFDSMNLGCYWDATWFAGFRYVEFDENRLLGPVIITQNDFAGYGLTAGGELRRCLGNNLAGFLNVRGSVLMGDETDMRLVVPVEQLDSIKYIWEAQAGAQYTVPLADGGYLFARAAIEVQEWIGMGASQNLLFQSPAGDLTTENVGFGGFAFSAGIIR